MLLAASLKTLATRFGILFNRCWPRFGNNILQPGCVPLAERASPGPCEAGTSGGLYQNSPPGLSIVKKYRSTD